MSKKLHKNNILLNKISILITLILITGLLCSCGSSSGDINVPSDATQEEIEVLNRANDYLFSLGGFSEDSLKNQLDFEGFSTQDIEYALDNIDIDWKEQCLICAQEFLNGTSFSETELRTMLEKEGFSLSEIDYAISNVEF